MGIIASGISGAALLAIGSNMVVPIGVQTGGLVDLLGIAAMMLCFCLADGRWEDFCHLDAALYGRFGLMPRFHFHFWEHGVLLEDPEGQELSDLDRARNQAILAAREIMSEKLAAGRSPDHSRFEIADEAGKVVLIVPFTDAYSDEWQGAATPRRRNATANWK
jgi:hypothetical protein